MSGAIKHSIYKPVYKYINIALLMGVCVAGLMGPVPRLNILEESIRNLYFHVPMWFGMILLLGLSAWHSGRYLLKKDIKADTWAKAYTQAGLVFGIAGLASGAIWARYTWGAWWSNDPKQTASAIGLLLYIAYFAIRGAFEDQEQRARLSAVVNILCYFALIPLLFLLPRMTSSLHPGNGGNPGFSSYDLDNNMRMVFYPAVIGWFMLGLWMAELYARYDLLAKTKRYSV